MRSFCRFFKAVKTCSRKVTRIVPANFGYSSSEYLLDIPALAPQPLRRTLGKTGTMPPPTYIRSSLCIAKRVKIGPLKPDLLSLPPQPVAHSFRIKSTCSRVGISTTTAQGQADVQSVPPHSVLENRSLTCSNIDADDDPVRTASQLRPKPHLSSSSLFSIGKLAWPCPNTLADCSPLMLLSTQSPDYRGAFRRCT